MPKAVRIGVIGAGSGVFSLGLVKDLCLNENLRESEVSFMDLNQEVNWPNRGVIDGLPDDCVAEFRAIIDATGVHPLKPTPLPRKIMLEQVLPFWLDMERTLEAYKSRDRSALLWNILTSHQTRTYEQAVDVFQAILGDADHAALAAHYQGFDGYGERWKASPPVQAVAGGSDF